VRPSWGDAADVLALLAHRRHWTRAELSEATTLSRSTIAQRLDLLRDANLIAEVGQTASEGGRPTTKIALNDRIRTVAGVELGHASCRITVADLGGRPLAQTLLPIASADSYEPILEGVVSALRKLLEETSATHGGLASVTLGVPMSATIGAVGLRGSGHTPGWAGFPAQEWLETVLAVPVHLENDVNLMALGERLEAYPDVEDLLLVHVGDGVGTGAIAGGSLVRGAHGLAGEIAHVPALRMNDELCLCGNVGCLAAVATLPAVLRILEREGVIAHDLPDLMRLVADGNPNAVRVLRQAGRDVGDVLVYLIRPSSPATSRTRAVDANDSTAAVAAWP